MRYLPVKALFLSLTVHFILLNVFVFTVPLSRTSFKPTFVFLGPILKPQDVGDAFQRREKTADPLTFAQYSSNEGADNFFTVPGNAGRQFIEGAPRHPVPLTAVGAREKVMTKSLFDIPVEVKSEQAEAVIGPAEVDHEIAPYKPLGLFSR